MNEQKRMKELAGLNEVCINEVKIIKSDKLHDKIENLLDELKYTVWDFGAQFERRGKMAIQR